MRANASADPHVTCVAQRVARGGHDIPRADIERRYVRYRLNLIRLLAKLNQLVVYDIRTRSARPYSITRPTCSNKFGGTASPRALAVFMLSTNSNCVGRSIGSSATLAP